MVIAIIEKKLFEYFVKHEIRRKRNKNMQKNNAIIPKYVVKRHIEIISNGVTVFDNAGGKKDVPERIQHTIKSYGYPKTIKPTNKTPLIYDIKSNTSVPLKITDFD